MSTLSIASRSLRLALEQLLYFLQDIVQLYVTFHEIISRQIFSNTHDDFVAGLKVGEQNYSGRLTIFGVFTKLFQDRQTIHQRHTDIQHYKIRLFFKRQVQALLAVRSMENFVVVTQ